MISPLQNNRFFTIIGAQRSGTTYLYQMLNQHPDISMNKIIRPEPKFFLNPESDSIPLSQYITEVFQNHDESTLYGEKSTSYLEYGHLAMKINQYLPHPKILVVLRNPVNRAISNYAFSKGNKLDNRPPKIALDINNENKNSIPKHLSVSPFSYISRGIYIDFLQPYIEVFASRLKIILYEDLIGNIQTIQDIYKFLEVPESFKPTDIVKKYNESIGVQISDELRTKLEEFYAPWNKKLESKLGVSLNVWKQ